MSVIIKTGRFGHLTVENDERIRIPQGILGFPDLKEYCVVDPGDDTLILWLQSLEQPSLAFPILEPKIYRPDYCVRLSAAEARELKLENLNKAAVFSILTIPEDVSQMTANLKAPVVINVKERVAKQVVLQENEYSVKHTLFKELRAHLMTIQNHLAGQSKAQVVAPVRIEDLPPSPAIKTLQI